MALVEIYKQFRFDAAHFLPHAPEGHPNKRVHGHSFRAEVWLKGKPSDEKGWIRDFGAIDQALADVREGLDHHFLNEIEGLELPTLERIALYVYDSLKPILPELDRVAIHRDSYGEGCVYRGEDEG